ncbi:glycosyltransferase family 4 protein [Stygiolobus caldivivus]|uniref:Glycosyl transferase family 1 domain-containing protein n=1 Tax=Stygiolobus caldivivus TaxID=2824673 RepID=A0A8D5U427_9CREN|nr:glycosyltransferase [Stygiolobus caldivivus]BCU69055.1 hypothetical protein KN1_03520 [Stygiolobus caldivivus]
MIKTLYINIGEPSLSGATSTIVELIKRSENFSIKFGIIEFLGKGERGLVENYPELKEHLIYYELIRKNYDPKTLFGKSYRFLYKSIALRSIVSKVGKDFDLIVGYSYRSKSVNLIFAEPFIQFPLYKFLLSLIKMSNPIEGTVWFINTLNYYSRIKKSGKNICAGSILKDKLEKDYGVTCIPLEPPAGVDIDQIRRATESATTKYDAIHVARLGYMKGTPDTIYVMRKLKELGYNSFALIGPQDYRFNLNDYLNDTDNIEYLGKIEDKYKLYNLMSSSKIMIYPTYIDSFGIVVAETLASGTPVVTYNIPAMQKYFGDCEAVKLAEIGNKEDLLRKALILLNDYEYYKKVAVDCGTRYSWDNVAYSFSQIVKNILNYN